jgi:hypothetical protein
VAHFAQFLEVVIHYDSAATPILRVYKFIVCHQSSPVPFKERG